MRDATIKSKLLRHKGMRRHNAVGKVLLFELFRGGSKVYIHYNPRAKPKILLPSYTM